MDKNFFLNLFRKSKFVARRRQLQQAPLSLHRLNIFIIPTRAGLFFCLVLILMLIGAINYNNSLAFMLTFLLGSTVIITIFHTYRNLWRLRFTPGDVTPVFCGQSLQIPLRIENYGEPCRYTLRFHFNYKDDANAEVFDLPKSRFQTIVLHRPTIQRGRHDLCRFVVSTTYPLGLFRAWAFLNFKHPILVYPQMIGNPHLPTPHLSHLNAEGAQGSGQDDFIGLRTFQPGDAMGHINWKSFAKDQTLLTKQFGGEGQTEIWLDWNLLPYLDFESRLSQLACWVVEAQKSLLDFGLRLPGLEIPPASGEHHRHQCLTALADFNQG